MVKDSKNKTGETNKYILILKGTNKELAILEFETLFETYFGEKISLICVKNILYEFSSLIDLENLSESVSSFLSRLTFTNFICKVLVCDDLLEKIYSKVPSVVQKLDFEGKSFRVRVKKSRIKYKVNFVNDRELAKPIWDSFVNPCVNIENPDVEFNYIFVEDKEVIFFGVKVYENDKDYLRRMPKLRPVAMPYTLKSDMARVSINLLGLDSGCVLDPFCGIGGILLEAYDMKFDVIGNDISWNDLKYFKTNFEFYFPESSYIRTLADSRTQFLKTDSIDGIVTDIPYGKSSRKLGDDLYEDFLKSARQYLKKGKRLIIIYANFVEFKELALKYFDEVVEIEQYINRSMTRYVLVLKNNK